MKKLFAALAVATALSAAPLAGAQAPAAAPAIVGSWDVTTTSPVGETTNTMVITREGDALKAVAKGDGGAQM
jgi:hypothetical protein